MLILWYENSNTIACGVVSDNGVVSADRHLVCADAVVVSADTAVVSADTTVVSADGVSRVLTMCR